jgi:hypothetical protein
MWIYTCYIKTWITIGAHSLFLETGAFSFEALIIAVVVPMITWWQNDASCRRSHCLTSLTALSVWQARLLRCFIILENRWKSDGANDNYTEDEEESPSVICSRGVIVVWATCMCVCVISGFCYKADENCTLLGYYAVSCGNFLPTFLDSLSVSSLGFKNPKESKMVLEPWRWDQ